MQMIKNVEEHFLCSILSSQKLNIINDQHIYLHVEVSEAFYIPVFDGIHELIHEFLGGNIKDELILRSVFDFITNRLY